MSNRSRKASDPENPEKNPKKKRPETMNERFFGDPGPGRRIRPGRLLIRKTRKNPKKKTRNHEREIFRGSGPEPQGSGIRARAAGIREILVSERIQKDEQQVQEGF
ncbi:unnamed protein product [Caenorhabditis auriculariae]|uniref:Uncharacterized protein n=1 Tax=Caenorhabditis auriculariae TaxID=2777116 RepID=A0A8S1H9S9_9PELO|nr:unnamed protein product [Caenorhabditis auriculariae]